MISDDPIKGMNAILAGHSSPMEELYGWFRNRPGGGDVWFLSSSEEVLDVAAHNRIHLILIEPSSFGFNVPVITLKLREISPEAVIAFLGNDSELDKLITSSSAHVRRRLSHYYRVHRGRGGMFDSSADSKSFTQLLKDTAAWHAKFLSEYSYSPRYQYDVALSFAGEDRMTADSLAHSMKAASLNVFFDDFEKANLWGKDLFTTLHEVYSQQARYCIMLISKAYAEKVWTVHERRAAQERALNERDNEYLLPIRIDDTPLPGLPRTIAYLDASMGAEKITGLFLEKLAAKLASQRPVLQTKDS